MDGLAKRQRPERPAKMTRAELAALDAPGVRPRFHWCREERCSN